MAKLFTRCTCFIALLLMPCIFMAQTNDHPSNDNNMNTIERNKRVIRDMYGQMNQRNFELLKEIIAPEFQGTSGKKGVAAFEEGVLPLLKAFTDIRWTLNSTTAEGNIVIARWSWTGTHTSAFQYFPPTGKVVTTNGFSIFEFQNGKIIKSEVLPDRLSFLQSMGLVPTDLSALIKNE